jgi:hypothetical protein
VGRRTHLVSVVVVAISAIFMANLDLWIVNVALVGMQRSLGGSLADLSWVLNAYAVTLAALLIPAGRLGDRIGHRRMFSAESRSSRSRRWSAPWPRTSRCWWWRVSCRRPEPPR